MQSLKKTREATASELCRVHGGGALAVGGYSGPPLAVWPPVGKYVPDLGFADLPVPVDPPEYNDPRRNDPQR